MAATILEKRELYIDVTVKEDRADEIYLYQVDFFKDRTFRIGEFPYRTEVMETTEETEEEQPAPPEPLELFSRQWELLCQEEIPTEVYATDARVHHRPIVPDGNLFMTVSVWDA